MFLDEPAEALVVFFFHPDEFATASIGADVVNDGGVQGFDGLPGGRVVNFSQDYSIRGAKQDRGAVRKNVCRMAIIQRITAKAEPDWLFGKFKELPPCDAVANDEINSINRRWQPGQRNLPQPLRELTPGNS